MAQCKTKGDRDVKVVKVTATNASPELACPDGYVGKGM